MRTKVRDQAFSVVPQQEPTTREMGFLTRTKSTEIMLVLCGLGTVDSGKSTRTCWFQEENQQELVDSKRKLVGSVQMTKCLLR